jgi:hypothetical protein
VTDGAGKGLSWTTDAKGQAVGPLSPGDYDVSAFLADTRSMPQAEGVLRARPGAGGELSLEVPRGEQLKGRVVDAAGKPVGGAYVSGVPEVRTENGQGWGNARSQEDGSFLLDGLRRGALTVEARKPSPTPKGASSFC